jgi:hypothetical protein
MLHRSGPVSKAKRQLDTSATATGGDAPIGSQTLATASTEVPVTTPSAPTATPSQQGPAVVLRLRIRHLQDACAAERARARRLDAEREHAIAQAASLGSTCAHLAERVEMLEDERDRAIAAASRLRTICDDLRASRASAQPLNTTR